MTQSYFCAPPARYASGILPATRNTLIAIGIISLACLTLNTALDKIVGPPIDQTSATALAIGG
jgi:hypothetical protein